MYRIMCLYIYTKGMCMYVYIYIYDYMTICHTDESSPLVHEFGVQSDVDFGLEGRLNGSGDLV